MSLNAADRVREAEVSKLKNHRAKQENGWHSPAAFPRFVSCQTERVGHLPCLEGRLDWTSFEKSRAPAFPAYGDALFEVHWPDAGTTVLKQGALSGPVPDQDLVLITAYNPGTHRPGEEANRKANEEMKSLLQRAGLSFYEALGRNEEGTYKEPSFAVALEEGPARWQLAFLCSLAGQFGQAAVFFWDAHRRYGRTLWLAGALSPSGEAPGAAEMGEVQ